MIGNQELYEMYKEVQLNNNRKPLPFKEYIETLKEFSLQVTDLILNGFTKFTFGHGTGYIKLQVKPRVNKIMDWQSSVKLLIELAKELAPELLDKYPNGVKSDRLVKDMKPYVYHPETNPTAPKWILYKVQDNEVWVHWTKKDCNIVNKKIYTFKPSCLCNYKTKDGKKVNMSHIKEHVTIKDIPKLSCIGMLQKKNLYLELDPNHINKLERVG